jgi:ABC-type lipoprotein export system ATPase subunit
LEEFNQEGRTIVMVTHDPRAARRAKRLLKLTHGTVVSAENVVDVSKNLAEGEEEARDAA